MKKIAGILVTVAAFIIYGYIGAMIYSLTQTPVKEKVCDCNGDINSLRFEIVDVFSDYFDYRITPAINTAVEKEKADWKRNEAILSLKIQARIDALEAEIQKLEKKMRQSQRNQCF